jgi:choline kinase
MHSPSFTAPGGSASNPPTPSLGPLHTSGSSTALAATAVPTTISAFMLDSRAPPGDRYTYQEQEAQTEHKVEEETHRLMAEARLWRLANSAMWVAWGCVQAHVPGMPQEESNDSKDDTNEMAAELDSATKEVKDAAEATADKDTKGKSADQAEPEVEDEAEHHQEQSEEEEFDYLGYAQERAMFFWGDAIKLGIIKAEELPEQLKKMVKIVEY